MGGFHQTRIACADRVPLSVDQVETRKVDPWTFYSLRLRTTF